MGAKLDRDLKDVFAVHSDVAEKVANALKAQLLPAESVRIANLPTQNQQAYDLFLQGQYVNNQLETNTVGDPVAVGKTAVDFYRRAIAADPDFAFAYARLSHLQSYLYWYGIDNRTEVVDAAREARRPRTGLAARVARGTPGHGLRPLLDASRLRPRCESSISRMPACPAMRRSSRQSLTSSAGRANWRPAFWSCRRPACSPPRNSVYIREMASSQAALRHYANADAAYAKSLAITPGDAETLVQRATVRIQSGNLAAAEHMLATVPADLDPQASVSLLRFKLAMLQRQPDEALTVIEHAPG